MDSARVIVKRFNELVRPTETTNVTGINVTDVTYVRMTMKDHGTTELSSSVIVVFVYVIIGVLGIVPNATLIYLIFTRKFMRVKYIFTASISIAHVMMCVGAFPLVIVVNVTHDVTVSSACHVIVSYTVGVVSYSMLATAIRRCLALSERFRHENFTYRGKVKNIAFIWVFSLAVSLPYIWFPNNPPYNLTDNDFHKLLTSEVNGSSNSSNIRVLFLENRHGLEESIYKTKTSEVKNSTDDVRAYSNSSNQQQLWVYSVVIVTLQIVIPVCVSLALHINIYKGLRGRPNQIHWVNEISITKQHTIMAVVFIVCWFPLVCVNLISNHVTVSTSVSCVLRLLAASSVTYNPVIYFLLNAHIHRELLQWRNSMLQRQPNEN